MDTKVSTNAAGMNPMMTLQNRMSPLAPVAYAVNPTTTNEMTFRTRKYPFRR